MKVAIVGGAPSSEHLAPFDDPEWEIWVHGNQMDRHLNRRVTRIFEIHDDLSEHNNQYSLWLCNLKIPLVVGEGFPAQSAEHVERYPYEEAKAILGGHLTSTPACMMAYAYLHGVEEIAIYGVDMAVDDFEYFYQRPSMYAWISFYKGQNIPVHIPDESPLFKDFYIEGKGSGGKPDLGLPPFTEENFQEVANIHASKIEELNAQIEERKRLINTHHGCQQSYERLAKVARSVEAGQQHTSLKDSMRLK